MEKLPEDAWIVIFSLLGSKDIENAANSCQTWQNIITTTPLLARKLSLCINFANAKEKPRMKLPYKNLHLENIYYNNKIDELFQNNLAGVEKLLMKTSKFVYSIQILTKFPNLTSLVAAGIDKWYKIDNRKINLPSLTHLKVDHTAFFLLSKLQSHKIKVFFAKFQRFDDGEEMILGEFLQACDELKHVTLKSVYTDEILKIKSQLVTFELIHKYRTLPSSFIQFLKCQKSTLKNLTLDVRKFNDEIADFIYFEMDLDRIVDYRKEQGQMQELKRATVKNLSFYFVTAEFEWFEKLFECCDALEVLSLNVPKNQQKFLRSLSILPKLKFLKLNRDIGVLLGEFEPIFKLNRLERLILTENFNKNECVKIIRCCPSLTHVKMTATLTEHDFEDILKVCQNLQEIFLCNVENVSSEYSAVLIDIGSKVKIKIEATDKLVNEKLGNVKNRLTIVPATSPINDPILVRPKILSHLYFDLGDQDFLDNYCIKELKIFSWT